MQEVFRLKRQIGAGLLLLAALALFGCSNQKVMVVHVPDEVQKKVESVAPPEQAVFYVSATQNPRTYEDLYSYQLSVCATEDLAQRAPNLNGVLSQKVTVQVGSSLRACLREVEDNPRVLFLTERSRRLPNKAHVVEVEFK